MAKSKKAVKKAVILAAGRGARLRPITDSIPKPIIPVANKPVLFYTLEKLAESRIKDIGLVISPETGSRVRDVLGDGTRWGVEISYITQPKSLGTAHAIKMAEKFLDDSAFIAIMGDILFRDSINGSIDGFQDTDSDGLVLLKEVPDPRAYGVVELDNSGKIVSITEKPKRPASNLILAGIYLFTSAIFQAISRIKPSSRGELEIPDAIQTLVNTGNDVMWSALCGWWHDIATSNNLLAANRAILNESVKPQVKGEVDRFSQFVGIAEVGENTRIENSLVRGPVSIAENCRISNSVIGPHVSVGAGTAISDSHVEDSIIMDDCYISGVKHMAEAIIDRNARVEL